MVHISDPPAGPRKAAKVMPDTPIDVRRMNKALAALVVHGRPLDDARSALLESLRFGVLAKGGAERARIAISVDALRQLDQVDEARAVDNARVAEVDRLTKLAASVADRDQAQAYREQIEAIKAEFPTPADVVELHKVAAGHRARARQLSDGDAMVAAFRAAEAAETHAARIEERLKAAGVAVRTVTAEDQLFSEMSGQCRDLHGRISAVMSKSVGADVEHVLEADTINKAASGPADRWLALSADFAAVGSRLDVLERMPIPGGPTRIAPAHITKALTEDTDPDLVKAAGYRRTASGLRDRDQARAYITMAEDLEERARQKDHR